MTLTIMFILLLGFCVFCLSFGWAMLDKKEEMELESRRLRLDRDLMVRQNERLRELIQEQEAKTDAECLELWVKKEAE